MYGLRDDDDPKSRQRCTDCPCCIIFLGALGVFAMLYIKVLTHGDIGRLYHGIDVNGRVCGVDPGVEDTPYLYWCMKSHFASAPQISLNSPICVDRCPGSSSSGASANTMYEIEPDCAQVLGADGMASYRTVVVFDRFCLPDPSIFPDLAKQVSSGNLAEKQVWAMATLSSIHSAWPVLLGSFFVAVMLGYLYLVLLRHCAEPLIWLTMVLCVVGFAAMGTYLFANAGTLSTQLGGDTRNQLPEQATGNEEQVTKIAGVVCWVISIALAALACCMAHSILIGAACVEVACDTIFEMPSLLLLPVIKAFFKGVSALVLITGFLLLYSCSGIDHNTADRSPQYTHSQEQQAEIIFYMLMSFWILCFINALYQFIVAYAVAEYYYTPYDHDKEKDVGCCAVWDGVYYGLVSHGGSLAFGSLIIAVFMVIQKIIERAEQRNKEAGDNKVVDCILGCCLCCVSCFKGLIEHVNKNAYIDIAITSDSFCEAAKSALAMIVELGGAMAILNGATFIFALFGIVLISLGSGAFAQFMVTRGTFADPMSEFNVASPIAPTVLACGIGLVVALSFMHVFDMTSDTLLYCYGMDLRNGKPGHTAPEALKELVHGSGHD